MDDPIVVISSASSVFCMSFGNFIWYSIMTYAACHAPADVSDSFP
jgi:hypothetical protein